MVRVVSIPGQLSVERVNEPRLVLSLADSPVQYRKCWAAGLELGPAVRFQNRPTETLELPEAALEIAFQ
jgi:hypothetical protein